MAERADASTAATEAVDRAVGVGPAAVVADRAEAVALVVVVDRAEAVARVARAEAAAATGVPGADPVIGAGARGLAIVALLAAAVATARPGLDIKIGISGQGFDPAVVTLRKGETVRVALSTGDGEHCFAVDAFRLEKRVVAARTTSFDFTPDRVGRFPFYCCVESGEASRIERGELIVTE